MCLFARGDYDRYNNYVDHLSAIKKTILYDYCTNVQVKEFFVCIRL